MIKLNCERMASGHYARVSSQGERLLMKSKNTKRDQSFYLSSLTYKERERLLLPLGDFADKAEIFEYCKQRGYEYDMSSESRGICFVNGTYYDYIAKNTNTDLSADIYNLAGEYLCSTDNYTSYTVGQRKNIPKPYAVHSIDAERRKIIVALEENLYSREIKLRNASYYVPIDSDKVYAVKMFNWGYFLKAKVEPANSKLVFNDIVRAAAVGQQAVIYDGDYVVGCGIIDK